MMFSLRAALLTLAVATPSLAHADEAIFVTVGVSADDTQRIRAAIEERLAGTQLRLVDPAATRSSLKAFLGKSIERATPADLHSLMKQTGASSVVVLRQLSREAAEKVVVFQAQAYAAEGEPDVRVRAVPEAKDALPKAVSGLVLEMLPRQDVTEEKEQEHPEKTKQPLFKKKLKLRT